MVKLGEGEIEEFATADEADGIRRTLDKFMKKQDERHDALEGTLDKLLLSLNKLYAQSPSPPPEDIGSTTKGKNNEKPTSTIPPIHHHFSKSVKKWSSNWRHQKVLHSS